MGASSGTGSRANASSQHAVSTEGFDPSRVSVSEAKCWTVRNGFAWAHIFLREGATEDRHWAHVSVVSDFGSFGYCWSHMGAPWALFCQRLDFDYAMGKLMGTRFYEPLDLDECVEETRRLVLERRRNCGMSKEDARLLWDGAARCDDRAAFLRDLDHYSDGAMYRHELWDSRWDRPSREARCFWDEIWPAFTAAIAMEARKGDAQVQP